MNLLDVKRYFKLNRAMNRGLEDLDFWLKGNKLSLNIVKAQSKLIATNPLNKVLNNSAKNLKLEILRSELGVVTNTRYLGAQVDNDWNGSIKVISSKVSRASGFLKYAKNILSIASVKALYTSIVEPHFRYCCSVWCWCGAPKLQSRAARISMESSFNAASGPLIKNLGWNTNHW